MRIGVLLSGIIISLPIFSANDFYRNQLQQRISPIGKVRLQESEKDSAAKPSSDKPKAVAEKEPGAKVYDSYCAVCHRAGVAGAPKFREASDWASKIKEKGLDGLVTTAMSGINAMPPKGTCSKCSQDEIKQAIEYMIPQS